MTTNQPVMCAVNNYVGLSNNQSLGPTCTYALDDDARAYITMLNAAECPVYDDLSSTPRTWFPLHLPFIHTKVRGQRAVSQILPRRFWRKHSWG